MPQNYSALYEQSNINYINNTAFNLILLYEEHSKKEHVGFCRNSVMKQVIFTSY